MKCQCPTEVVVAFIDPNGAWADMESFERDDRSRYSRAKRLRAGDTFESRYGGGFEVINVVRRAERCFCDACLGSRYHTQRIIRVRYEDYATEPVLMQVTEDMVSDPQTGELDPQRVTRITRSFVAEVLGAAA